MICELLLLCPNLIQQLGVYKTTYNDKKFKIIEFKIVLLKFISIKFQITYFRII